LIAQLSLFTLGLRHGVIGLLVLFLLTLPLLALFRFLFCNGF